MSKLITLITLSLLFLLSCNSIENSKKLEDGMYLILRIGDTKAEVEPLAENEQIITFNKEFIDKTDQEPKFMVIKTDEFAPLQLKKKPETQEQEANGKRLFLTLTDDAKIKLEKFTSKNVNQLTSIVVNGEALTKHKIKEAITGGTLQITRCTDNACELLYVELQDNVINN
jgi:preprotein translocase subunit SecD